MVTKFFGEGNFVFFYIRKGESGVIILVPLIVMELGKQKEKTGIAKVNGELPLEIKGGTKVVKAIRSISKYGLITFSRDSIINYSLILLFVSHLKLALDGTKILQSKLLV